MTGNVRGPLSHFLHCRKMSEEKEKRGFQVGGFGAEVLDVDTSVFENPAMPIHIADCRFGCRHSVESRHEIVRHSRLSRVSGTSLSCLREDHLEMKHFDWHTDFSSHPDKLMFIRIVGTVGFATLVLAFFMLAHVSGTVPPTLSAKSWGATCRSAFKRVARSPRRWRERSGPCRRCEVDHGICAGPHIWLHRSLSSCYRSVSTGSRRTTYFRGSERNTQGPVTGCSQN